MKPGDMVCVLNGNLGASYRLFGGDDVPWDLERRMIPTILPFGFYDTGIILKSAGDQWHTYHKILTSRGTVGWVHNGWIGIVG